jgi:Velvet factor
MMTPSSDSFTRNLIGSTVVNATKMKDDKGELGIWFVMQDMSVRTEGSFRLKCSFVDLSDPNSPSGITQSYALILAECFSECFMVYSAKKFPGVIESTPLSKAFAQQGVKIPIRKDAKPVPNMDEYDQDDQNPAMGSQ